MPPNSGSCCAVQRRDSAGRAGEQFLEAARAHAEEGLMGKAQPGLGDELEIHQPLQGGVVGGANVLDPDLLRLDSLGQSFGSDRVADPGSSPPPGRWRNRPSRRKCDLSLKPLKVGGLWLAVIITPPTACWSFTAKETEGVGVGSGREDDLEAVAGKHLGGAAGKCVREKPPVVADDDLPSRCRRPDSPLQ